MGCTGRRTLVLALLFVGALALAGGAAAHALLQSSDPPAGATLASAPAVVTLTFGEAPDPRLSSVRILDTSGTDHAAVPAEPVAGRPDQLRVALKPLPDGVYTVAWRTLSSVDGHVAAGSFAFGVGAAPGTASAADAGQDAGHGATTGGLPATLGRWLLYMGLVTLVGAGFVGVFVNPGAPRSSILLSAFGWLAFAVGTIIVVTVQLSDAGADAATIVASSLGRSTAARFASIILVGAAVGGLFVSRWRSTRRLLGLTALGGAAAMLVDVLAGHAAAGDLPLVQVVVQWLHILAVGLWIGGLGALLVSTRGLPSEDKASPIRRFSRAAAGALAIVALTGIARAVVEVGSLDALVATDFGRLVIVKSGLLIGLAILGAANRFVNVPRAGYALAGLRRIGSTEVAIGACVLLLTALLVNLAPPTSVAGQPSAAPPAPLIASGADFGTSVRLRLIISPGTAGFNDFTAAVVDYDTGAPAPAASVSLRFSLASKAGVGSSTRALAQTAPGMFGASGGNLSLDGIWRIVATVAGPSGSVEVPLVLASRIPAQPTAVSAAAGVPTIYTAQLAQGRSVQVYLDPGLAGQNELHATFFDAAGSELAVPTATMSSATPDGTTALLTARQLEPGHFVAEANVAAGSLAVDVVGAGPDGDQLHAHVELTVQS